MRFSVVIPVYNAGRFIFECAQSLLDQKDFSDYELIFIDDGSTDGGPEILDELEKKNSKIRVVHTPNRGSVLARIEGIGRASGEYVMFCDADDLYSPDCMRTVDEALKATEADILVWNYSRLSEENGLVNNPPLFEGEKVFDFQNKSELYREVIRGWRLNTLWNKAIARNLFFDDTTDYVRFSDCALGDDLLLSLRPFTQAKKVAYIERMLYLYRTNPAGLTQTFDEKRYQRAMDSRVLKQLRSYLPTWGMDTEEYRVLFAKRCLLDRIDVAMSAFRRASDAEAERNVLNRNWFKSLPVQPGETGKAVSALSVKSRVQYELIRVRCRLLLHLLAGKAGK